MADWKIEEHALQLENLYFIILGYNMVLKDQREAAKNSEGLPCSVQIVTLPYEEELCLHAMKQVEAVWRKNWYKAR